MDREDRQKKKLDPIEVEALQPPESGNVAKTSVDAQGASDPQVVFFCFPLRFLKIGNDVFPTPFVCCLLFLLDFAIEPLFAGTRVARSGA